MKKIILPEGYRVRSKTKIDREDYVVGYNKETGSIYCFIFNSNKQFGRNPRYIVQIR